MKSALASACALVVSLCVASGGLAHAGTVRGIAVGEPNPSAPHPAAASPRRSGYGALRLGMTVAAARRAWPGTLHGDAVESGKCGYLLPAWSSGSRQLGFMFEHGRFVRYDVGTRRDIAPGGGRVGMTRRQLESLYRGRVTTSPHHYVAGGLQLRVRGGGAGSPALVFETDETGKITSWRAGLAPQVDYVEGCS